MSPGKRAFDLAVAGGAGLLLAPLIAVLAALLLVAQGRPVLHRSERMRNAATGFALLKFRTMRPAPPQGDAGVTGADKAARITPIGRRLRRARLDELPQLWNVLRGDMSLVGPRPPLREYVERFPGLYARVLACRPGITGLATLAFHAHEARILAATRTAAETDAAYARRCVPRKAALDLIYARHASVCFDAAILLRTALRVLRR